MDGHEAFVGHSSKPVRIMIGDDGENYILGTIPLDDHGRLHPLELVRFLRAAADHAAAALEKTHDDESQGAEASHGT